MKELKNSDVVIKIPKILEESDSHQTVTTKSKSPPISEKYSQKDPEKDPQYDDSFSEDFTKNRSTSEYYTENLRVLPRTKAIVENQPSSGELGSSSPQISSQKTEEETDESESSSEPQQNSNIRPRTNELDIGDSNTKKEY